MIDEFELVEVLEGEEQESAFKLGTVAGLFGNNTARIRFDGETEESKKEYSYLANFSPKEGQRVLLAKVSETYIILGNIKFQEKIEEPSDKDLVVKKLIARELEVNTRTRLMHLNHLGELSFFNQQRPSRKIPVNTLSSNASETNIIKKINEMIQALNAYGLF